MIRLLIFLCLPFVFSFAYACVYFPTTSFRPNVSKSDLPMPPGNIADPASICSTDFANFSFDSVFEKSRHVVLIDGIQKPSLTNDGIEYRLNGIYFGDVTHDKSTDALVILDIVTGGSSIPRVLYVFQSNSGKPQAIWSFQSGDRADGGFKSLYSQDGDLVVETYKEDSNGADCCPRMFEKKLLSWTGKAFAIQKSESMVSRDNSANFHLPRTLCN